MSFIPTKNRILLYDEAKDVTVLGPGNRYVVWVQGCRKRCVGCISEGSRSFDGGTVCTPEEVARRILQSGAEGLTVSGGESMLQAAEAASFTYRKDGRDNVNAGTFTFKAVSLNNSNYTLNGASGVTSETYNIARKTVEILWTPPADLTENGEQKIPSAVVNNPEWNRGTSAVPLSLCRREATTSMRVRSRTKSKASKGKTSANYCLPGEGCISPTYTITESAAPNTIAYLPERGYSVPAGVRGKYTAETADGR